MKTKGIICRICCNASYNHNFSKNLNGLSPRRQVVKVCILEDGIQNIYLFLNEKEIGIMKQLEGVKVVDLSTYIAAPSCGRILASYGAEVIKVESPKGDDLRKAQVSYNYPAEEGEYSLGMDVQNANKKGLCLNLKTPEGMEAMLKLLETADVFLTNNRVQALVKMGLDWDTLHAKFPRLIHASILGYGEHGPLKDKPGFDYTAYFSRGGIANSLMEKGTAPAVPVSGFGDDYAGIALSSGICAALYRQAKTGEGERVTVSLLDAAAYGLNWMLGATEFGSELPASRTKTNSAVCTTYKTKDNRWIQLALIQYDNWFPKFAKEGLNAPELLEDPRFATYAAMLENIPELVAAIEPYMAAKTLDEWDEILTKLDLPFERVQTMDELANDPQMWANDSIFKKEYKGKNVYYIRTPIKFTLDPMLKEEAGRGRGPKLGEDTTEILKGLGYDDATIKEYLEKGIAVEK